MTPKAMKKEKGDQLDFIKIKNFCVKQYYQESENQFTQQDVYKLYSSRIYKISYILLL